MGSKTYRIARMRDGDLSRALTSLGGIEPFTATVQGFDTTVATVTFPQGEEPTWNRIVELDGEVVHHMGFTFRGVKCTFNRGEANSPFLDELSITPKSVDAGSLEAVSQILDVFRPVRPFPAGTEAEARAALLESNLSRLQMLQEQMVASTVTLRQELDAQLATKKAELEAEFRTREERVNRSAEVRKAQLDEIDAKLKARAAELDDSDNTYARRQIRDNMLEDVRTRMSKFGISEATAEKRRPVVHGMLALIGALFALVVWTVADLVTLRSEYLGALSAHLARASAVVGAASAPSMQAPLLLSSTDYSGERLSLWLRLAVTSFGLVAMGIYYIKWQSAWAQDHARAEFNLQQFQVDINRANWVMESCLEWRKETQSAIPGELLASMTRGLFDSSRAATEQVLHPADELASAILGTASKVTLDANGNKIEIDKPARLSKAVTRSD